MRPPRPKPLRAHSCFRFHARFHAGFRFNARSHARNSARFKAPHPTFARVGHRRSCATMEKRVQKELSNLSAESADATAGIRIEPVGDNLSTRRRALPACLPHSH